MHPAIPLGMNNLLCQLLKVLLEGGARHGGFFKDVASAEENVQTLPPFRAPCSDDLSVWVCKGSASSPRSMTILRRQPGPELSVVLTEALAGTSNSLFSPASPALIMRVLPSQRPGMLLSVPGNPVWDSNSDSTHHDNSSCLLLCAYCRSGKMPSLYKHYPAFSSKLSYKVGILISCCR